MQCVTVKTPCLHDDASRQPLPRSDTSRVVEIDPLRDPRWSALAEVHPSASVFHRVEWLRALSWTYGYEPFAVAEGLSNSTLSSGIVLCRIKSPLTGRRLVSLPFSDYCDLLVDADTDSGPLISNLLEVVDQDRWEYLEMRNTSSHFAARDKFTANTSYLLHRLDLTPNENELFARLHKNCIQRKIRRAQRESLRYEAGNSDALLKDFYKLLVMTRRRHGFPPQPFKWFRNLAVSFGDRLKIHLVSKNTVPVASILTLSHKKTMTYKYACSDVRYHRLGGPSFGLWMAVIEAKSQGFEELDMGRSSVDNAGLIAFKEHWGAQKSRLTYWRYPAAPHHSSRGWTMRVMKKLVSVMPHRLLATSGNLLYPHIG